MNGVKSKWRARWAVFSAAGVLLSVPALAGEIYPRAAAAAAAQQTAAGIQRMVAPLAPVKLPALQMAVPGLINFVRLSVTPPLMLIPPLAVTMELVTVPPLKVNGPVTVIGLVPPSVPAVMFTAATVPALL
jgi:hypothetical protein